MSTTKTDPLAQRDALLDTLARVDTREDELNARHRELHAAHLAAETTLAQTRIAEVKGEATPAAVERARLARDEAAAAVAELGPENDAAQAVRKQTGRALWKLARKHREEFEAEAEEASAAAVVAVEALAPALREAAQAWAEAQGAWHRLGRQLDPTDAPPLPEGAHLGPVPAFPLAVSLDGVQPRPADRQHDAAVELIADQVAVFQDQRNGREVKAVVGSVLWRDALGAPQRFALLRHEDA